VKLIYIAGKFRGPTAWDIEQNIRRAEEVGMEVALLGGAPVIPHANMRFFRGTKDDAFWLAATMAMLERCDAVMMVPNWPHSAGACAERDRAMELGLPVFESDTTETAPGGAFSEWLKERID
jgi:hypothetical protein